MTTQEIAKDVAALCAALKFSECGEKYWAEDVVTTEPGAPPGMDRVVKGISGARAKAAWWADAHETHSVKVTGPFVNDDQFILHFEMDVTVRATGHEMHMNEMALYKVKSGKIVEETFFYSG